MGTPNITGQYSGTYNIVVRATTNDDGQLGLVQAFSGTADDPLGATKWKWDFDNKVVVLDNGRLTPRPGAAPLPIINFFNYETYADDTKQSNVLSFIEDDEAPGFYIVHYYFKAIPNGDENFPLQPEEDTNIRLEITQLKDGSIVVVTAPGANGIPGTPLNPPFPRGAAPDWRGRATKV